MTLRVPSSLIPDRVFYAQMPLPAKDDPASSDGDFTDLVGPPPPEVAEMVANASASDAGSEVVRIVALLDRLESQKLASKSGAPSADPYAILGVDPTLSGREIKRQFWKLSLLVHPDKCLAPDANKAFAALSHAAEELLVRKGDRGHEARASLPAPLLTAPLGCPGRMQQSAAESTRTGRKRRRAPRSNTS